MVKQNIIICLGNIYETQIRQQAMKKPIEGMTKTPLGKDEMAPAWAGCFRWALSEKELRSKFRIETGFDVDHVLKATGINAMIDKATGYQKEMVIKFADWVTEKIWGVEP